VKRCRLKCHKGGLAEGGIGRWTDVMWCERFTGTKTTYTREGAPGMLHVAPAVVLLLCLKKTTRREWCVVPIGGANQSCILHHDVFRVIGCNVYFIL